MEVERGSLTLKWCSMLSANESHHFMTLNIYRIEFLGSEDLRCHLKPAI